VYDLPYISTPKEREEVRILEARSEEVGPGLTKITVFIAHSDHIEIEKTAPDDGLGEGPSRDAVTDHIVRALIDKLPDVSLSGAEIIKHTGDHPGTTYRQLRVLATNSGECPHRLRGWVRSFGQGRYGLTQAARRRLEGAA
jgi:hypothetical protein